LRVPFTVTIERIIPGGRGLARHEGRAVFVPHVVSGDQIRVQNVNDRRSYLEVMEFDILSPSAERVPPPCRYFGQCGGCDFQQMSDARQLAAKEEMLLDALRHIGKIDFQDSQIRVHASPSTGYRNRLQLKPIVSERRFSWGYYEAGSHEVCGVEECLISSPLLWRELEGLKRTLEAVPSVCRHVEEVDVFLGDDGCLAELILREAPGGLSAAAESLRVVEHPSGLNLRLRLPTSGGKWSSEVRHATVCGSGYVWKAVEPFRYRVSHGAFFQINDPMLPLLRNVATEGCRGENALELFCGVGFFCLQLARNFGRVHAVEINPAAVSDLKAGLQANSIVNCDVFEADLRVFLSRHSNLSQNMDLLLIDPPRAGLPKEAVHAVAEIRAREIVYVSCDPATLSRDLRILREHQYEIASLDLLDLFPQTHHLEAVARLRRS